MNTRLDARMHYTAFEKFMIGLWNVMIMSLFLTCVGNLGYQIGKLVIFLIY
jgi:hypothetical protein